MDGWIGLDVGTTSSKAVAYDPTGRHLADGKSPTRWSRTTQGVEIPAERLVDSALAALAGALAGLPPSVRVAGLGITSMGETGVLVDGRGEPVTAAIAWHDDRDTTEVGELARDLGADEFGARAGKPLRGQFSITKYRWLTRHDAAVGAAVRRFNVADWVARALGADEVCDRVLACRTGWYDVAANAWWDDALAWSGTSTDLMPELVDPGTAIGRVAAGTGLERLAAAVLTTAGHDHQAAALGVGVVGSGDVLDSSGTAEALVRTVAPDLDRGQVLALARAGITTDRSIQPGQWSLLGGTEGGLELQQALDRLGVTPEGLPELDRLALAASDGDDAGPGQSWRGAVEAATAEAVALHEAMTSVVGRHRRIVATGGWCRSAMVLDAKRRGLGTLSVSSVAEAGTLGAATMAARAAGQLGPDQVLAGQVASDER